MKRDIIEINEALCDGCGDCVVGCAEGAIQIINGKAKLVRDDFCDGFGDCVGHCHAGAITITKKEVVEFDEEAVVKHLGQTQGPEAVARMKEAQVRHHHDGGGVQELPLAGGAPKPSGCPSSVAKTFDRPKSAPVGDGGPSQAIPSDLGQWPIQLHLVPPNAEFFKNKELAVIATCGPFASADLHWRFLRGRSLVIACPKLDDTSPYLEKLQAILSEPSIPKVKVAVMEVPCCQGLVQLVQEAAARTGRKDLVVEKTTIDLQGRIV